MNGIEFRICFYDRIEGSIGKEIKSIEINDPPDENGHVFHSFVLIKFSDDSRLKLFDSSDCCEARYMMTDDDLSSLVGDKFKGIELKSCMEIDDDNEAHEACFMEIQSDKCFVTICAHNEHNGCYSGFSLGVSI